MTDQEQWLCDTLERCSSLSTDSEVEQFMEACRALPLSADPKVLRRMLMCLTPVHAGEVQYELVEAVERFPNEVYVPVVIDEIKSILERSENWGWMIFQSLLNTRECLDIVFQHLPLMSDQKRLALLDAVDLLVERDVRYASIKRLFYSRDV